MQLRNKRLTAGKRGNYSDVAGVLQEERLYREEHPEEFADYVGQSAGEPDRERQTGKSKSPVERARDRCPVQQIQGKTHTIQSNSFNLFVLY